MKPTIRGIHHVTAIAGDPQQNIDFYTGLLGLRMVKLTVNFDDPYTYHLYYGDDRGAPGSVLTFFPWPGASRGSRGAGQATVVSFSVPEGSLPFWQRRLTERGVPVSEPVGRMRSQAISFHDPDDLALEIVEDSAERRPPMPARALVPAERSIRGFHSVTLSEADGRATADFLTRSLGFRLVSQEGNRARYEAGEGGPGAAVDLLDEPRLERGLVSVGTVHHVAFRTPDDEEQAAWQETIRRAGHQVTPVADRHYFRSIYFREPGGVLFEIATDLPGFTIDEPVERLGGGLALPPWLEPRREAIARQLPPVSVPAA